MRVGNERVTQVRDPTGAGRARDRRAIRCVEPGGEVETTTSIPCSRTSLIPAGIAVIAQVAFSSGTTSRRS